MENGQKVKELYVLEDGWNSSLLKISSLLSFGCSFFFWGYIYLKRKINERVVLIETKIWGK